MVSPRRIAFGPRRARQEARQEVRMRKQQAARGAHEPGQPFSPAHTIDVGHLDIGQQRVHQRVEQRRLVSEVAVERVRRDAQSVGQTAHCQSIHALVLDEFPRLTQNRLGRQAGALAGPAASRLT